MKTLKLIIIALVLFFTTSVQAQVSVNVHLPSPPMWAPAGYNEVQYYYLPDVEAYYDVQSSMFIYYSRGAWVHRTYLPSRYRNYDLYGGYKVVMNDYHGNTPYSQFNEHRRQYARGYRGQPQRTIGERPGRGNSGAKMNKRENHGGNNGENHNNNNNKVKRGNNNGSPQGNNNKGHGDRKGKR